MKIRWKEVRRVLNQFPCLTNIQLHVADVTLLNERRDGGLTCPQKMSLRRTKNGFVGY